MRKLTRIGMDTSKSVFQLHGVDDDEQPALKRRKLRSAGFEQVLRQPFHAFGSEWKLAEKLPIIGRANFRR